MNVFESPWLLLIAAAISFIVVMTIRNASEKNRIALLLIPVLIAASAYSLDHFIVTDKEQINNILNNIKKVITNRDAQLFEQIVSSDYTDSVHKSKDTLMIFAKIALSKPAINKVQYNKGEILFKDNIASQEVTIFLSIDENSMYANYGKAVIVDASLEFSKSPSNMWHLSTFEVDSVQKQPMNWRSIKSHIK